MKTENFYNILGVEENSTQEEIKKAYRKKAVEHHPDKGGSEEEFKKISEAYDMLGDEQKRKQYDNQKNNPFAGFGGGGGNPFEDFFGNQFYRQRKRVVPDKVIEITVGVLESYNANEKTITYQRKHPCNTCNGGGGDKTKCNSCNGVGYSEIKIGTGIFVQIVRQPCALCKGNGFMYKTRCTTCNGETTVNSMETITIKLPHGIDEGQFLKLQEKGDFQQGMYGNLILKIKVIPENNFEKSGNDLVYNSYLNLSEVQNDELDIPHPDGKLNIKLPNEFDTSKPLRVRSKGYNLEGKGDLFIKLFVRFKRNP
jgi:molecular chaperone DnaJ